MFIVPTDDDDDTDRSLNGSVEKFLWLQTSVIRSGKISPIWLKFKTLWQFFEGLFSIWRNPELTLVKFKCYWANSHGCKWAIIEKLTSYLVTRLQTLPTYVCGPIERIHSQKKRKKLGHLRRVVMFKHTQFSCCWNRPSPVCFSYSKSHSVLPTYLTTRNHLVNSALH